MAPGEVVAWGRNQPDRGPTNGQVVTVLRVNAGVMRIRATEGRVVDVDVHRPERPCDQHRPDDVADGVDTFRALEVAMSLAMLDCPADRTPCADDELTRLRAASGARGSPAVGEARPSLNLRVHVERVERHGRRLLRRSGPRAARPSARRRHAIAQSAESVSQRTLAASRRCLRSRISTGVPTVGGASLRASTRRCRRSRRTSASSRVSRGSRCSDIRITEGCGAPWHSWTSGCRTTSSLAIPTSLRWRSAGSHEPAFGDDRAGARVSLRCRMSATSTEERRALAGRRELAKCGRRVRRRERPSALPRSCGSLPARRPQTCRSCT